MATKQTFDNNLQQNLVRVVRVHFIYVLALIAQIMIYHAWQLITPEAALQRWMATGLFTVGVTAVWYLAKNTNSIHRLRMLIYSLVMFDIAIASFGVYTQRGMAARAIALFAIPIIVASTLKSRSALLATATLCVVAYTTAAFAYFVVNFNEGFKVELYGEVGFYSILFFVIAKLLWANSHSNSQ